MKNIFKGLLTSFFGVFFALFLIEIGFRLFYDFSPKKAEWTDRPAFYFRDEKAATLQDKYHSTARPENTWRLAMIGDSYTFAPYMQFTDTFSEKLEQMLNLNDVSLKAEVINYGVPAYSTSHEIAAAEKAISEQADLLIVQITLNDAELKPYRPQGIRTDLDDPFAPLEFHGFMAKLVSYWRTLGFILTRLHNQKTHTAYKNYFIDLFDKKRGWKSFTQSFVNIQNQCKNHNVRLAAVIFPLFGLPLDDSYPFKELHQKIGKFLKEQSIEYLDIYPYFKGIPIDRMQVIPGVDRHPNEIAHRIAAEAIYQWLEDKSMIPEDLKIRFKYSERMGITNKGLLQN